MNRGAIPGYYYDEEKKKYFKIQANHIAPPDAKYNKMNVKLERNESKKRKREQAHQSIARKQTVVTARALKHTFLSGSGFQREIGHRPYASHHVQRDHAFVQGLERSESRLKIWGFDSKSNYATDALYLADIDQLLVAMRHDTSSHAVYSFDLSRQKDWGRDGLTVLPHQRPIHAFHEPITALQRVSFSGMPFVVTGTAAPNKFSGNIFVGPIRNPNSGGGIRQGYAFNIGSASVGDLMWDMKADDAHNPLVACAGTFGVEIHSIETQMQSLTRLGTEDTGEIFAVEWLNPHTLAMGMKQFARNTNYHDVFLWDIRTDGISQRLECKDKIKGIYKPDNSGNNLICASSREISLYDLRNTSKTDPVLSLDHQSGSPHVHMSILNGNLLAATDWSNRLQVYSLRAGKRLRTLHPCNKRKGLLYRPRWQEDWRGAPYLHACVEDTIQRWA